MPYIPPFLVTYVLQSTNEEIVFLFRGEDEAQNFISLLSFFLLSLGCIEGCVDGGEEGICNVYLQEFFSLSPSQFPVLL